MRLHIAFFDHRRECSLEGSLVLNRSGLGAPSSRFRLIVRALYGLPARRREIEAIFARKAIAVEHRGGSRMSSKLNSSRHASLSFSVSFSISE